MCVCVLVFYYKPTLRTVFVQADVKRAKQEEKPAVRGQAGAQQDHNVSHTASGGGEV